ncbi:PPC domain-containing protein [Nannocystis radixulma]|uniref:PPC domain-containing protein n=1 Tax=Nannocystis radixulma TaxID=2995305 RepID=A0ABT5B5A8_9BACT|nr:PPC domain-containing protein [Nannocystis radixulma]MDC0668287.1 PPC domain-containing protein [Nannocystis radixulma]
MHSASEVVAYGSRSSSRTRRECSRSAWWRRAAALAAPTLLFLVGRTASAAPPPANDAFANATVVPSVPFSDVERTVDATREAGEPIPSCVPANGHTVWYSFTPDADIVINANTQGSNYDTTLTVYTGSFASLTEIDCNDNTFDLQSSVTFLAMAGETYFFMVGSFGDVDGGNLKFAIQEGIEVSITVDSGIVDPVTRQATVSGTVRCTSSATVEIDGAIEQRAKQRSVFAEFDTEVLCVEGQEAAWSAVTDRGGFKSGRAVFAVQAVTGVNFAEVLDSITLKYSR